MGQAWWRDPYWRFCHYPAVRRHHATNSSAMDITQDRKTHFMTQSALEIILLNIDQPGKLNSTGSVYHSISLLGIMIHNMQKEPLFYNRLYQHQLNKGIVKWQMQYSEMSPSSMTSAGAALEYSSPWWLTPAMPWPSRNFMCSVKESSLWSEK